MANLHHLYNYNQGRHLAAPLTYFDDGRGGGGGGGGSKGFLGLTFWPKGIFLGRENNTRIFLGIVFFINSNQQ